MQKRGVISCFSKILDRGGNFTPPNNLAYPKKPNYNRVKEFPIDPKFQKFFEENVS